ncbi:MAG: S24 family peptidase [Bosea sp. (in: a-proteobacteria)]
MLSHDQIWGAIDALAERYQMTPSGLAKRAGLDATTFNRSKRIGADGRERWPSTESLAKILAATGANLDEFISLVANIGRKAMRQRTIPLIGFAQAGTGGFFDDNGLPSGNGWDEVAFPDISDERCYALEINGDSMMPLYRDGDTIIVSPSAPVRRGDRVVVRTMEGEVLAKELKRKTLKTVELASLNPDHADRVLQLTDVSFIARVIWASQ